MATNISFSTYGFMNGILILSEENWRRFFKPFITDSVQNGLATIAGANMTVYVSAGECRCGAVMGILDEMIALDIANGDSTYDRIDSVIVQYTYGEPSTLAVAIIQGTPSANPVPPTLTKVYDTLWQMEIAQILVPSGATSSSEFTITDKRVIYESIESIIDDDIESEERVWSSQKTHEEIVSLSSEIYDRLNTKADAIERTTSGPIVTITDGADNIPVKELVVDIEPVQDLHGYDNPWPPRGGKNFVEISDATLAKPDYYTGTWDGTTKAGEGAITVTRGNGQGGAGGFVIYGLAAGTYRLSFKMPASSSSKYMYWGYKPVNGEYSGSISLDGAAAATTYKTWEIILEEDMESIYFRPVPNNADKPMTFSEIQLELGSTATPYEPYSNICPITGWSEANVWRTGKNLFDFASNLRSAGHDHDWYYVKNADGSITITRDADKSGWGYITSAIKAYLPEGTYTLNVSKTLPFGLRLHAVYADDTEQNVLVLAPGTTSVSQTFQKRIRTIRLDTYSGGTSAHNETFFIWMNVGSTATSYEPYNGQTITINLDGTRYGGALDVLTGVLKVTNAIDTFDGDENITVESSDGLRISYALPLSYAKKNTGTSISDMMSNSILLSTSGKNSEADRNKTTVRGAGWSGESIAYLFTAEGTLQTVDSVKAYLQEHPLQLLYQMNTPITVTGLTPAQISTLLGTNNIWADTGNILNLTYPAPTGSKSFIDEQIAESQIKTRQMITIVTNQMIAPDNLNINDIIVVNDELYKVINSNIASGEAMVIGTNVIKITLAEYIQSLL